MESRSNTHSPLAGCTPQRQQIANEMGRSPAAMPRAHWQHDPRHPLSLSPTPPQPERHYTIRSSGSRNDPYASLQYPPPVHPPPPALSPTGSPSPSRQRSHTHPLHHVAPVYGNGHGGYYPLANDVNATEYPSVQPPPPSASSLVYQQREDANAIPRANNATHRFRIRPDGKGYNVLCFDGGGCKGYASLLTTRNILRRLVPAPTPAYPYLHYDLICGTSTGGLIAILLAVLHLDIDTAIRVYEVFGKTVFGARGSKLRYLLQDERFNSKLLKRAVSEILEKYGEGRTLMEDPRFDRGCKCFVTVAHMSQVKAQVLLVRSYPPPRGTDAIPNGHHWTILDAAMATAAAPTFFRAHQIVKEGHPFHFEDAGAHGANNPTLRAWRELNSDCFPNVGGPNCFVSIGTGTKGIPTGGAIGSNYKGAWRILNNLTNINVRRKALSKGLVNQATDVNEVHDTMEGVTTETRTPYYRFNPPQLGRIPLTDYRAVPAIQHTMFNYHAERNTNAELDKCSRHVDVRTDSSVDR